MATDDGLTPSESVLGLRARRGPYRNLALPIEPGLTALYGLNGAGKTWALRTLRECADGLSTARWRDEFAQLLVDAPPTGYLYGWIVDHLPGTDAGKTTTFARLDPESLEDPEARAWQLERDQRALRKAIARAFSDPHAPFRFGPPLIDGTEFVDASDFVDEPFVTELSRSTTFALVPVGYRRKEWEVWLCIPPLDDRESATREELRSAVQQVEQARAAIEGLNLLSGTDEEIEAQDEVVTRGWVKAIHHPLFSWVWHHGWDDYNEPYLHSFNPLWGHLSDGLPLPVAKLCNLYDFEPLSMLDESGSNSVYDDLTATRFKRAGWWDDDASAPEMSVSVTPEMQAWVTQTEAVANEIYLSLLREAPSLSLTLRPPREWLNSSALTWRADGMRIDELSKAEARWAGFAIRWALGPEPHIILVDEPEAALHRAAEEHLARGLSSLGLVTARMVVATHSPFLLDDPATSVVEVSRQPVLVEEFDGLTDVRPRGDSRGFAFARPMGRIERDDLERLGLQPSDLLRRTRVFVLVEGEHDEIVIRAACASDLEEARARVLPLRGAGKLAGTVESEVLFEFTDAHLVAVLDNVEVPEVTDAWVEAQYLATTDGWPKAVEQLNDRWRDRSQEFKAMAAWLGRALKNGSGARLTPLGLPARDIIEYLPVGAILPGSSKTWMELRSEHDAAKSSLSRDKRDFKRWLASQAGREVSVEIIAAAAQALGTTHPVHDDLQQLGRRIRMIGYAQRR